MRSTPGMARLLREIAHQRIDASLETLRRRPEGFVLIAGIALSGVWTLSSCD